MVVLRLRGRAQRTEVRPRLRLGKIHRAGAFAGDEQSQESRLELLAAMVAQGAGGRGGQHRAARERQIRGFPDLAHRDRHELRKILTAPLLFERQAAPASLDEL